MLNRSKLWAAALLLASFAAGIAVGGAASTAWGDNARNGKPGRERHRSYAERLQAELQLSVNQRDSINAILARREVQMDAMWQEIAPRFDSLRMAIRGEIMTLLDDGQRGKYGALIARSDSLRAERRHGGRHGKR